MRKKTRSLGSLILGVFVALALLWASQTPFEIARAGETVTTSCADITFGTSEYSSTGAVNSASFSTKNFTVDSVSATSAYCLKDNASQAAKDAARIGASGTAGTLSFAFASTRISKVKVLAYQYGTDSAKVATCSVLTSAQPSAQSLSVEATSAPDISDSSSETGLVFTNLDNGGVASTSLTISGTSTARFNLCKIVLTILSLAQTPSSSSVNPTSITSNEGAYTPISFHFVEQGNAYSGDCTYIKAGDNDILIDAGNRVGCASTIETYLEDSSRSGDYVADGKLEYVIATHAHQDHIAGFVGVTDSSAAGKNGVLYHYDIGTLIDFPLTNSTSAIYANYQTARDYAVSKGAKHFNALKCYNNAGNGAERTYSLGNGLSMSILYNSSYENTSSDENNYSVCVLFTQGSKHFLFTGDLEADGEAGLVSNNTLPIVELYKGGHHGSYTANTDALLSVIQPKLICICACVGNSEYAGTDPQSFPAQSAIDRMAPYTDRVYCTTLGDWSDSSSHTPMNGNILVHYDASSAETLSCSASGLKLKETAWFKTHRTCPSAWA